MLSKFSFDTFIEEPNLKQKPIFTHVNWFKKCTDTIVNIILDLYKDLKCVVEVDFQRVAVYVLLLKG